MNYSNFIGWDIGGAHLKVASVSNVGEINFVEQYATPLWQGLDKLSNIFPVAINKIPRGPVAHAVTMTAELVDIFENRQAGIDTLTALCKEYLGEQINLYAATGNFLKANEFNEQTTSIASANWHASALVTASLVDTGVFVDIGSTTTDIIPFQDKKLLNIGFDDQTRLRSDELLYTGIIRTPLMALAQKVPFAGYWQSIAAEHFATTADVYRVLGLLNEEDDLMESADGAIKDSEHSLKRLARMVGADAARYNYNNWYKLAEYFADVQKRLISDSILRVTSKQPDKEIRIIGAGTGRFLIKEIAERLNYPYIEFSELFSCATQLQHQCNVCAPAVAVAQLSRLNILQ